MTRRASTVTAASSCHSERETARGADDEENDQALVILSRRSAAKNPINRAVIAPSGGDSSPSHSTRWHSLRAGSAAEDGRGIRCLKHHDRSVAGRFLAVPFASLRASFAARNDIW